jgi:hypothetical protein
MRVLRIHMNATGNKEMARAISSVLATFVCKHKRGVVFALNDQVEEEGEVLED